MVPRHCARTPSPAVIAMVRSDGQSSRLPEAAARVVQVQGQRYDKKNHLLMHAAGANTGGQIGSVVAAAVMLSVLKGMGMI